MTFLQLVADSERIAVPAFLENPWFLAVFGWVFYNFIKLWIDQKKYDTNNDGLGLEEVGIFFRHEWLGMLLSLFMLPFVTPYMPDFWMWGMDLWGKDYPFINLAYGGVGVLMMGLQHAVSWFRKKRKDNAS